MTDSNHLKTNEILSLCYRLYQDPIYRHVYFPRRDSSEREVLTEELFLQTWESLAKSPQAEVSGLPKAIYRAVTALGQLNQVEQIVLLLRFVEGLPYREIARTIDKSEGACHVIHYRALSALTTFLNEEPATRDYAHV